MKGLSVNEAIDRVLELNGQVVSVIGKLSLEFEGTCLYHIPRSEWRSNRDPYHSSIWVAFDLAQLQQPHEWLDQFDNRHVLLAGVISAPLEDFGGCGHFSLWPAELRVSAIRKIGGDGYVD